MKPVPRASLSITLLADEDYAVLMGHKHGPEAFGIFVATVVAGRERLTQGKASQIPDTESLRFENSIEYVASLVRVSVARLDRCLATLAECAGLVNGDPWMHLDKSGHVVIRSFFKFNTKTGWGGQRPGAGRPATENQDGIKATVPEINLNSRRNQDDSNLKATSFPSGSGSGPLEEHCCPPTPKTETPNTHPAVLPATPDGPPNPAMCPPYPDGELLDIHSGPHAIPDETARDIFRKVWLVSGRAKVCNEFYEHQRKHSAETWLEALRELTRRGEQPQGINFIHLIAGDVETGKLNRPNLKPFREPKPEIVHPWDRIHRAPRGGHQQPA